VTRIRNGDVQTWGKSDILQLINTPSTHPKYKQTLLLAGPASSRARLPALRRGGGDEDFCRLPLDNFTCCETSAAGSVRGQPAVLRLSAGGFLERVPGSLLWSTRGGCGVEGLELVAEIRAGRYFSKAKASDWFRSLAREEPESQVGHALAIPPPWSFARRAATSSREPCRRPPGLFCRIFGLKLCFRLLIPAGSPPQRERQQQSQREGKRAAHVQTRRGALVCIGNT